MHNRLVALLALVAVGAAPQKQRPSTVTTGGEQIVRIGRLSVARPFGADLVDRVSVVGTYHLRGRPVYLVRGDAAGACPARFVFVAERRGTAPGVSSAFGACGGDARVQVLRDSLLVSIAAPAGGAAAGRFSYDGTTVTPSIANATPDRLCLSAAGIGATEQAATIAAFADDYEARYGGRNIGKEEIGERDLRTLVTELACLAPWPAGADRVPTIATPLFASRHGTAAFAALASVAEDPSSGPQLRAASRGFAAEMAYRVERREPL